MTTDYGDLPASPRPEHAWYPGMTIHDWYAGLAMQGFCACYTCVSDEVLDNADDLDLHVGDVKELDGSDYDRIAAFSHGVADAMIAERNKRKEANEQTERA